ncbi:MAG TPA: pseudouridine synthase [Candidatus Eremiobacteraceae bacterium]
MPIRINKFLADAGVASRRKADELIAGGAVLVNGKRAEPGTIVDPDSDDIRMANKRLTVPPTPHVTLVLNKPAGVVTTMSDDRGRPTVADLMPKGRRLFPVGRLDADTTGVLLCTSDGALAQTLAHPSHGVEKRYRATVSSEPSVASLNRLSGGSARRNPNGTFSIDIVLHEGKNRQVRRMCANEGLRVVALTRISFGPISLNGLKSGKFRALTSAERSALDKLQIGRRTH